MLNMIEGLDTAEVVRRIFAKKQDINESWDALLSLQASNRRDPYQDWFLRELDAIKDGHDIFGLDFLHESQVWLQGHSTSVDFKDLYEVYFCACRMKGRNPLAKLYINIVDIFPPSLRNDV